MFSLSPEVEVRTGHCVLQGLHIRILVCLRILDRFGGVGELGF